MNVFSKNIGIDLVSVKSLSAPNMNLMYINTIYGVIREDIFVAIVSSDSLKITKGKKYDVGILNVEKEDVIKFRNDDGGEIIIYSFKEYFITLIESRKQKINNLNSKGFKRK